MTGIMLIDMGNRFRIICAEIEMFEPKFDMPNLPVARLTWKPKPNFKVGAAAWIYSGGAHHAVVSTALTAEDIRLFAKLTDSELVIIDSNTEIHKLEAELKMLDCISRFK